MDSISSFMIPSLARSVINSSHSMCFPFTIQVYVLSMVFPASPEFSHYGKADSHQLCRKLGQSILLHYFRIKSWFRTCQSFPQDILLRDKSSHGHPFILRVFFTHKFSIALPYCDTPVVIIVTTSTQHTYMWHINKEVSFFQMVPNVPK
jgi:hypothetical protein